jgi:hypothetical protein
MGSRVESCLVEDCKIFVEGTLEAAVLRHNHTTVGQVVHSDLVEVVPLTAPEVLHNLSEPL